MNAGFQVRSVRGLASLWLAVVLCVPACRGPGLSLRAGEPDAAIYLDGAYVDVGAADLPQPYYGVAHATVAPARRGVIEDVRTSQRHRIELPPPAPRWLFPLDFFLEAWHRGFGDAGDLEVELPVEAPAASLTAGVPPPQQEALRARAAAIQTAR